MSDQTNVRLQGKSLLISQLTIDDVPTVSYIADFPAGKREAAVINCIQLGARASQFASDRIGAANICDRIDDSAAKAQLLLGVISKTTQTQVDRAIADVFGGNGKNGRFQQKIEAELSSLHKELATELDPERASSITAKLRGAIQTDVGSVLAGIRRELNLSDPSSPLGLLRADLDAKHKSLEQKLAELVKQEAVRNAVGVEHLKGSGKGSDFEDEVEPVLAAICRPRHDRLERTAREAGLNGRSKRGDFVVEINPRETGGLGLRIVIEAKNDQKKLRDLVRELDEAIENRAARYAIAISTNADLLPSGSPPIAFCDDNKIIVVVGDETDDPDSWVCVEVALEVARHLAIATRNAPERPVDLLKVDGLVKQAINALARLTELKKRLTTITSTATEAHGLVDVIRTEIRSSLQVIRDAIDAEMTADREENAAAGTDAA